MARLARVYRRVDRVRWEILDDEPAAAAREADLVVALQPRANAALAGDGRWVHVVVRPAGDHRLSFTLEPAPVAGARAYGCFPHLGRGVGSLPGTACSDGYPALLRLLWAAADRGPVPNALTRVAPPSGTVPVATEHRRALHDLLTGTSVRLLGSLADVNARADAHLQPGLRRDGELAAGFFRYGPRRQRALRLRHGLPTGPVARAEVERLLADEVRAVIGPFHVPAPLPEDTLLGARLARGRALGRLR
jgi:hypothetical protein